MRMDPYKTQIFHFLLSVADITIAKYTTSSSRDVTGLCHDSQCPPIFALLITLSSSVWTGRKFNKLGLFGSATFYPFCWSWAAPHEPGMQQACSSTNVFTSLQKVVLQGIPVRSRIMPSLRYQTHNLEMSATLPGVLYFPRCWKLVSIVWNTLFFITVQSLIFSSIGHISICFLNTSVILFRYATL